MSVVHGQGLWWVCNGQGEHRKGTVGVKGTLWGYGWHCECTSACVVGKGPCLVQGTT